MKKISLIALLICFMLPIEKRAKNLSDPPLKIGIIGLVHTHVHWILGRMDDGDFEVVAIVEPNRELASRYAEQYGYSMDIVFDTMEEMMANSQPEAVTAFNTIRDHLPVVEFCAPRSIHVMVEKPLAVSLKDAEKMASLAREHNIHLLTNYETTWYGSNHQVHEMLEEEKETFGDIRKIVVHDGHPGPVKLDINKEFLEWLIDPYWNGAGALTDFGCYGANLSTWLMKGQRPTSVMAVTQQIQPDLYPLVDDEATIILTYPESQTIIQASWNWNYNRKDMEVYTLKGYLHAENRTDLSIMRSEETGVEKEKISERESPLNDPFAYMIAVIRNEIQPDPADLSSLENNLIVMEILDAAMKSAKKGKKVNLK